MADVNPNPSGFRWKRCFIDLARVVAVHPDVDENDDPMSKIVFDTAVDRLNEGQVNFLLFDLSDEDLGDLLDALMIYRSNR